LPDFEKQLSNDILIEKVNLPEATTMEAGIMKKRLTEDIQLKRKKIIVDLSECYLIDEIFLGALVVSLKRSREAGGNIKVVMSSSVAEKIPNITGFQKVFENYSSVDDALKSFRS
jgi:anti-anti-sigma regulatory factor